VVEEGALVVVGGARLAESLRSFSRSEVLSALLAPGAAERPLRRRLGRIGLEGEAGVGSSLGPWRRLAGRSRAAAAMEASPARLAEDLVGVESSGERSSPKRSSSPSVGLMTTSSSSSSWKLTTLPTMV